MKNKKRLGALSCMLMTWPSILIALAACLFFNWIGLSILSALLLLLGLLGLLSRLWAAYALQRVNANLKAPHSTLFAGESVTVTYTVENHKFLPLIWLEICQQAPLNRCMTPDDSFALYQMEEQEVALEGCSTLYRRRILFLLGWRSLDWETVWTAQKRGVYPLRDFTLRSGDGFGLTQVVKTVSLPDCPTFVVWPRLVGVTAAPFLRNVWQGQTGRRGYVEDPTVLRTLRDYQDTDSWKYIDWRMAARQEELQVKQFETVLPATIHFIVDGASFAGLSEENEELEKALSILGSLLLELDHTGVTCGLSLPQTAQQVALTLTPGAPSLTVEDLMGAISAFDGDSATGLFEEESIRTLSQTVGQVWLLCHSRERLSCSTLLDTLDEHSFGVLTLANDDHWNCRTLSLSALKVGGEPL